MKNILLGLGILTLTLTFTLSGCESSSNSNATNSKDQSSESYYCPMKCEGEKTYATQGTCPVCKMDLINE